VQPTGRHMELDRPCSRQEALGFRLSPAFYAHHLLVAFSMHAFRLVPMPSIPPVCQSLPTGCSRYHPRVSTWSLRGYRPSRVNGSVCIEVGPGVTVDSAPTALSPTQGLRAVVRCDWSNFLFEFKIKYLNSKTIHF
jgi:hypothetical protein